MDPGFGITGHGSNPKGKRFSTGVPRSIIKIFLPLLERRVAAIVPIKAVSKTIISWSIISPCRNGWDVEGLRACSELDEG